MTFVVADTIAALNFIKAVELPNEGKINGYDENYMKLLPNSMPCNWGPDVGPNFSVVSAAHGGRITTDFQMEPDDWTVVKPKAMGLAGRQYIMPLDDVKYQFLLSGKEVNDEVCNGGLYFVMSLGPAGHKFIDSARADLDLQPFPPDFAVHVTSAKITDQEGHASFRQWPIMQNWLRVDQTTQLNRVLDTLEYNESHAESQQDVTQLSAEPVQKASRDWNGEILSSS